MVSLSINIITTLILCFKEHIPEDINSLLIDYIDKVNMQPWFNKIKNLHNDYYKHVKIYYNNKFIYGY